MNTAARRDVTATVAPAFVFVALVAYSAAFYHSYFTLRAALLLILLGPGLVMLAIQAARSDRAAQAALGVLGVSAVSTLVARNPQGALWGHPNWGTGFLFIAACLGVWALGRELSKTAAARVRAALGLGIAINTAIAVLQWIGGVPTELSAIGFRSHGLMGQPVHFAALCAAAVVVIPGNRGRLRLWEGAVIALAAGGVQLSGGRSGLALLVVALVLSASRLRTLRVTGAMAGLAVVGILGASALPGAGADMSATARLASDGQAVAGLSVRSAIWEVAIDAAQQRPLLGAGPGRFFEAISPNMSLAMARTGGDNRWVDAHNLFVEFLVVIGILGLLAVIVWLALCARTARGPWASFAFILGLAHLVQPMSVVLTPLMTFALGMSAPRPLAAVAKPDLRLWLSAAAVPGLIAGCLLVAGEQRLQEGSLDFSLEALAQADRLLPQSWPTVPLVSTRVEGFYGASDPAARERAIAAAKRATERAPDDPHTWLRLGALEGVWGSKSAAADAYAEALSRNPWSPGALRGFAKAAIDRGDEDLARRTCEKLQRINETGECANRRTGEW